MAARAPWPSCMRPSSASPGSCSAWCRPGFVPTQDKLYLVAFAQLPDAASLDRTEAVIRRMSEIGLKNPGVDGAIAFPGLSIKGFTDSSNAGIVFFRLKPFEERKGKALSGPAIAQCSQPAIRRHPGCVHRRVSAAAGRASAPWAVSSCRSRIAPIWVMTSCTLRRRERWRRPSRRRSSQASSRATTINVPQLDADVDRVKAKSQGVPLADVFETMQMYLGSLYVNDFNRFGRTYQVIAQADAQFRARPEDIRLLKTRNSQGQMVPLGALRERSARPTGPTASCATTVIPPRTSTAAPAPGFSTGQAMRSIARVLQRNAAERRRVRMDRSHLSGNPRGQHHHLRVPALRAARVPRAGRALRELGLPLAIILIVPMCLLFAITGVWLTGGDNNIFTQIGFSCSSVSRARTRS